jgi:hypothetical protein
VRRAFSSANRSFTFFCTSSNSFNDSGSRSYSLLSATRHSITSFDFAVYIVTDKPQVVTRVRHLPHRIGSNTLRLEDSGKIRWRNVGFMQDERFSTTWMSTQSVLIFSDTMPMLSKSQVSKSSASQSSLMSYASGQVKLSHKKGQQPKPCQWKKTRCSAVYPQNRNKPSDNELFFPADSFTAAHGDIIRKGQSGIFRGTADTRVSFFRSANTFN